MKDIFAIIGVIASFLAIFFLGVVTHEADLAKNFNETGNARCWVYEIKDSAIK